MLTKRWFDFVVAIALIIILAIPLLVIGLLIKMDSKGPALYISERVGRGNRPFKMYKFRTMKINTPVVATHLLEDAGKYVTTIGAFLRNISLDEVPQLINIIKGDMSLVGPRPALFNQEDLIGMRTAAGVHQLVPGLTGWAQINGRDELPIPEKVKYDRYYLEHQSFLFDLKILCRTCHKVLNKEGVIH